MEEDTDTDVDVAGNKGFDSNKGFVCGGVVK